MMNPTEIAEAHGRETDRLKDARSLIDGAINHLTEAAQSGAPHGESANLWTIIHDLNAQWGHVNRAYLLARGRFETARDFADDTNGARNY